MAGDPDPRPAVAVRDLWLTYPGAGGGPVHALAGIDLDVAAGEFVCLVGPSGCGKSTLLNVIAGFLRPTRGEVRADGQPVAGPDPRRVFIFQEGGVFPWLTVRENVGFGLLHRPPAEREPVVARYIDLVGLTGFGGSYPGALSGGMRQRVELARALAAGPAAVYMDEPFGALDFFTRVRMRADLIRIWEKERKTVLFVTHDIDEAVQLADRVVVLSARPARVRADIPVPLPRPRDPADHGYLAARGRVVDARGISLTDGGPTPAADCPHVNP
jgi:NitT/TauT family transport system ATP-binding protein